MNFQHYFKARRGEMVQMLKKMVDLESPSTDKNAVDACTAYVAREFRKVGAKVTNFPQEDIEDIILILQLEHFIQLLNKHIDLVERRIIKGEKIPHSEKMFSIFETYTELIKKGKFHPDVEFGKKLAITTDQFNLIVDYQLMFDQQDRDITLNVADRLLAKYNIFSWSFDKGFWNKETKATLIQPPKTPEFALSPSGRAVVLQEA